jgi:hypothetical protein
MSTSLQFVITGTGPTGTYWLSKPNERGFRSLATRERAAVFLTLTDADAAIAQMRQVLTGVGIVFSVEALSPPLQLTPVPNRETRR